MFGDGSNGDTALVAPIFQGDAYCIYSRAGTRAVGWRAGIADLLDPCRAPTDKTTVRNEIKLPMLVSSFFWVLHQQGAR